MTHLTLLAVVRAFRAILVVVLVSSGNLAAQPRIVLPKDQFKVQEQIRATLENNESRPLTICIEWGQWSPKGDSIESTPSPFFVEKLRGEKWEILLNGPDIGTNRQPEELDPGKTLVFPFRLNEQGIMRLRLDYWVGARANLDCKNHPKRAKHVRSRVFTVE